MSNSDLYFGFTLAGVILGLGSAVVILFLGMFSLKSNYWFKILNGTDKLAIPLLWIGTLFLGIALVLSDPIQDSLSVPFSIKLILLIVLAVNGSYLSLSFRPVIRKQENNPQMTFLNLPMPHQLFIFIAGGISALTWTTHAIILWLEIIRH